MAPQTQKRKHKTLTIREKNEILERLNRNESFNSLASEYGVGRSTIYDINKNRENIQKYVSIIDCEPGKRKTLKKPGYPEVEEALYKWYLQERNKDTPISGPMLAMKAKHFYKEITKKNDFVPNKGWLERFKTRYFIRLLTVTEEKPPSNYANCIDVFKLRFSQKIKDLALCPSQVYIANETGLLWRILDSKTLFAHNEQSLPERKVSNERVTISPCANASGTHRLKMVVIGKCMNPQALQNIDLPVQYYGQHRAWMTKEIFKQWFHECFVPEVKQWLEDHNLFQKALLLLDNAAEHPCEEELTSEDKSITAIFLPPNCSTLIQPMIHNVIQVIKQDYKQKLLLTAISKNQPVQKTLEQLNMKDLVFSLCQSWDLLPSSAITSSWENLWPEIVTDTNIIPQYNTPSEVIQRVAAETHIDSQNLTLWYHGMKEEEIVFSQLSDEEIGNDDSVSTIDQDNEYNEINTYTPQISVQDAVNGFELGIQWAEQNGASYNELLVLRNLRDKALLSQFGNVKQEQSDDYFQP